MNTTTHRYQFAAASLVLLFSLTASFADEGDEEARFIYPGERNPTLPDLYITGAAFSHGAEPTGFRDIAWGTPIGSLENMALLTTTPDGVAIYNRKDDAKNLDGAKVDRIYYAFHEGRFHAVLIYVKTERTRDKPESYEAFDALKQAVFERYGPGRPGNTYGWGENYHWQGEQAEMMLSRDGLYGICSLLIKQRVHE